MAATSSDEGEISDVAPEKATTSLSQLNSITVDRRDRHRSRSSSASFSSGDSRYDRPAERSRSPRQERQRGQKRARGDDSYDRRSADTRRFKVHYEDRPSDRRAHNSYDYAGRGASTSLSYDEENRYTDRRSRDRSRSPYRSSRRENPRVDEAKSSTASRSYEEGSSTNNNRTYAGSERDQKARKQPVSNRGRSPMPADSSIQEAKHLQGHTQSADSKQSGSQTSQAGISSGEQLLEDATEHEPVDEAILIEQRRKRREAIKAKYKSSATPLLAQALQQGIRPAPSTSAGGIDDSVSTRSVSPALSTPGTPTDSLDFASPGALSIDNDQDLANVTRNGAPGVEGDEPSAADYDPTMDMQEDQRRDDRRHIYETTSGSYDETRSAGEQDVLLPTTLTSNSTTNPKPKDELDMFAEDDDDMFAEDTATQESLPDIAEASVAVPIPEAKELHVGMLDNWDDPEGYYKVILGELLNGKYHVQANLGRGMFSGVVRATDVNTQKLVAIKIIRNNETMRKAGTKEIEILQKLNEADPDDKKHMIRLERHFEHKGHLCMVFEHLSINLREVLKKFGRDVGINIRAVRAYAQQMFLGLSLMRKCNILHADLKPDNILVNDNRSMLKVCDLGSASDASDNEITPYLVSRFYRAPEIILGMQYDFAIDVWSIGCTLYELYTGKILFTGRSNNQMLRSIMECRGKFSTKVLRKATFAHIHFDDVANFKSVEQDKLTGRDTVKTMAFAKPTRDLRTRLLGASKGLSDMELKELNLFADLLDKCLALNPEKRCTPAEALKHPFILRAVIR